MLFLFAFMYKNWLITIAPNTSEYMPGSNLANPEILIGREAMRVVQIQVMVFLQYNWKIKISIHCLYIIFYIEHATYQPTFTYSAYHMTNKYMYWAQTLHFHEPIITKCNLSSILIPSFISIHACILFNLSCYLFSCTQYHRLGRVARIIIRLPFSYIILAIMLRYSGKHLVISLKLCATEIYCFLKQPQLKTQI